MMLVKSLLTVALVAAATVLTASVMLALATPCLMASPFAIGVKAFFGAHC